MNVLRLPIMIIEDSRLADARSGTTANQGPKGTIRTCCDPGRALGLP